MVEKTAYNKKELLSLKLLFLKKQSVTRRFRNIMYATSNDSDNGTEDTSPTFKAFEEGSFTFQKKRILN